MARLRYNGLTATLGADLLTAGTTITFTSALQHAAGAVPTITGSDYIPLAILADDGTVLEIMHLTAYTTGATTGTVLRAQESTTATDHGSGLRVVHGLTVADATEFASGGGGSSGTAQVYRDGLAANYTSTTTGAWTAITGLSLSITPSVNGVLIVQTRLQATHTASTQLYARVNCTPAPAAGPTLIQFSDEGYPAGTLRKTLSPSGTLQLSAGTAYTISVEFFKGAAGTLTVESAAEGTEIAGTFIAT